MQSFGHECASEINNNYNNVFPPCTNIKLATLFSKYLERNLRIVSTARRLTKKLKTFAGRNTDKAEKNY